MSDNHKPLSAAEIEELIESIPGAVRTPGHIMVPTQVGFAIDAELQRLRSENARLLSMLQPPTDAAVREAVDNLALTLRLLGDSPPERVCIPVPWLRTILSYVRAAQAQPSNEKPCPVDGYMRDCAKCCHHPCPHKTQRAAQAPCLTGEQAEVVLRAWAFFDNYARMKGSIQAAVLARELNHVFPGLGDGA